MKNAETAVQIIAYLQEINFLMFARNTTSINLIWIKCCSCYSALPAAENTCSAQSADIPGTHRDLSVNKWVLTARVSPVSIRAALIRAPSNGDGKQ